MAVKGANNAITLRQLGETVSGVVGGAFPYGIWVTAEINSLQERGHCYLELIEKDTESDAIVAKAQATIWRSAYITMRMTFVKLTGSPLRTGMKVLVKVKPNLHPQYGYSLNIIDIDPSYTLGDAAVRRAVVVQKLKDEGVYDCNRELELPMLIKRIAVVSASGAAGYGDFINQLKANGGGYKYKTELFEAVMQGDSAEDSIIKAFDAIAERAGEFDVVAILRGGGAVSDLNCFDRYGVASVVAQFPLPVLSGIGHDRDVSVVDEVACVHLKTPTAVAAFIVECSVEAEQRLADITQCLNDYVKQYILECQSKVDFLGNGIVTAVKVGLERQMGRLNLFGSDLRASVRAYFDNKRHALEIAGQTIELTSPENVLKKGYSMAMSGGKVITKASGLKAGDTLTTLFSDGTVNSIVN